VLNWAIYLRELGTYMPPLAEGPTNALTDCNVTYRREVLEKIRAVWEERFDEPPVHGALTASGGTLWMSPGLLTFQQRTFTLGPAIRERYDFGRLYGSLRAAAISPGKRLLLIVASPLLPFVLTGRVLASVFAKRRHIGAAIAALPYMLLFAVVWACGELAGYLTGRAR
jgi:hypothetical protein